MQQETDRILAEIHKQLVIIGGALQALAKTAQAREERESSPRNERS